MDSKKHHYVPQSILRRFSIQADKKSLYVYDKHIGKSYSSSIINSGSENKYNTLETPAGNLNLEPLYQEMDNIYSVITKSIIDKGSLKGITFEDQFRIALVVVNQLKRTKLERLTYQHLDNELYNTMQKVCNDLGKNYKNSYEISSPEEIKALTILDSFDVTEELKAIMEKSIFLVKNNTDLPFFISDCPVVRYNSFPYSSNSLFDKGVEIYLPISPEHIIGFCCKTLVSKLKEIVTIGRTDVDPPKFNLLDAISEDVPIQVNDKEFVIFYNTQQILSSHRFIYSNENDFTLVSSVLEYVPAAKNISTMIELGEMGKGPPPNRKLPMGDHLIVYGLKDHYMLTIKIEEEINGRVLFTTYSTTVLDKILNDTPLEKIELYVDQHLRRFIRNAEIKLFNKVNGIYELSNGDKGLEELINKLMKDKVSK